MARLHLRLTWLCALGVEAATSSQALTEARQCQLLGGSLDLFRADEPHVPRCIWEPCPIGSDKDYGSCVAPHRPGQAREIALTLHSACDTCVADGGVELAGRLWLSLAAALQVPLQEMHVSVLLMRELLWRSSPLQHFTLEKGSQGPLVTPHGGVLLNAATDVGKSWDFFMAVRIHTARIDPGDPKYLQILSLHPSPILEAAGWNDGVNVFEVVQRTASQVEPLNGLKASFRIRGLPWGQEPNVDGSSSSEAPGDPRLRGTTVRVTTQAPHSPDCPCQPVWLGDGFCHQICNNEVCEWDRGDCAPSTSQGMENENEVRWPNGYYSPSTSEWESWLGDGGAGNRGPIIDMSADGPLLHVQADQEDGQSWWADEAQKEYAQGEGVSPLVLGGLSILGCCVPIVCFFARRSSRKDNTVSPCRVDEESWEDEERSPNRKHLSKFSNRTWTSQFSEETTDTGGSSPVASWPWGLSAKEAKVHPEPVDDPRPSRGDWRGRPPGPREAAREWHVPPVEPNNWHQRQEQARQQKQREKEERRKSHQKQTKEEQDAWQQDWIKKKREQEKIERAEKEQKLKEEELRREQHKEAQAQRQEKERQEEATKKEELRRVQEEAARRKEEQRKQQEHREKEMQEARRQEAQRQEAERREAQRKAKKKKKEPQAKGGFFGRWQSEPKEPRRTAASSTRPADREERARIAKEAAEAAEKEKQSEAAERKATSLMDSVMKQIDSTRTAPVEERKKVFKELQRQLHPDKNPQDPEAAKLAFQKLMENRNVYLA